VAAEAPKGGPRPVRKKAAPQRGQGKATDAPPARHQGMATAGEGAKGTTRAPQRGPRVGAPRPPPRPKEPQRPKQTGTRPAPGPPRAAPGPARRADAEFRAAGSLRGYRPGSWLKAGAGCAADGLAAGAVRGGWTAGRAQSG